MSDSDKPIRVPACANCARRKTKCDREAPCSNCVTAKLQCRYSQKRPEKKRRVLHSSRYEESLAHISHQLEALSNNLQASRKDDDVAVQANSIRDTPSVASTIIPVVAEPPRFSQSAGLIDQQDYEGESSFYSQSQKVADILGRSVPQSSGDGNSEYADTAGVVQALIQNARTAESTTSDEDLSQPAAGLFSHYPELADSSLPSMDAVLRILKLAKETPQKWFLRCTHTNEEEFADLCQKLYFPTQPFTIFAFISVNCGLFYLFHDLDKSQYGKLSLTQRQLRDHVAVCSGNVRRAVRSLRLLLQPSLEAVDALICAATFNMESAQGSLAWKLVSAAARMCLDLGFHRLPSGYGDRNRSRKRKLFWFVYAMDMSLAFNFGRSPTIQDYDVTTQRPTYSEDFITGRGSSFLEYVDFAMTQHDIYKQLFSARAQQDPSQTRSHRAHALAARLLQIKDNFMAAMNDENVKFRDTPPEAIQSINIGFSSILTLVYRVLPPDDFEQTQELADKFQPLRFHKLCVEAGRAALNALLFGWNDVSNDLDEDTTRIFMNWTLLVFPFMPFIAVFGNQIATGNDEDLILLKKVVSIVETAASSSHAMNKMHTALSRLLRIAELWMRTNDCRNQKAAETAAAQSQTVLNRDSQYAPVDRQSLLATSTMDVEMMAATAGDMSEANLQDLNLTQQDWDTMFNEFDLGLGADSARELIPWFEQYMSGSSTTG